MRELLYKNLTSASRKRKIIASSEIVDKEGLRNIIRRHFVYIIKEINKGDGQIKKPSSCLSIVRRRNQLDLKEEFFCKIKGGIYTVIYDKLFLVLFMHTLRIKFIAIPQEVA